MLRLWRFCDHRVFMMLRVVGVAAVGGGVLFGLGGVLAGVVWWAMRGGLGGADARAGRGWGGVCGFCGLRGAWASAGWVSVGSAGELGGGSAVRSGGGHRRARGSQLTYWSHASPRTGTPPPLRGLRSGRSGAGGGCRTTPALAGTRPSAEAAADAAPDRTTPALVGTTRSRPRRTSGGSDHPRPRGDHPSRPAPSDRLCHPFTHHRSPPSQPPTYAPPSHHTPQSTNPPPPPPPHLSNRLSFPTATAPARVSTPNFW